MNEQINLQQIILPRKGLNFKAKWQHNDGLEQIINLFIFTWKIKKSAGKFQNFKISLQDQKDRKSTHFTISRISTRCRSLYMTYAMKKIAAPLEKNKWIGVH